MGAHHEAETETDESRTNEKECIWSSGAHESISNDLGEGTERGSLPGNQ